ncbi:MAG: hypothetical protein DCC65_11475 [Planctomycetota bacterium]|nr:MAG: hypothetical protein DCC65_11475 [Planctomycetota bacterium]
MRTPEAHSHPPTQAAPPVRMQCMEVWGGNQPADLGVSMVGLDAWVFSRPYQGAAGGGDVHYVSSCATGRITRMLLADVSGHGTAVSDLAGSLRSLMRRYVNYLDQSSFVRKVNRRFGNMAADGTFATAVVTTFFAPTRDLTVSNAGHPPPLLYRARAGEWIPLEQRRSDAPGLANIPLGIVDETHYEQFGLRLDVGDLVLCYTDSLIEAREADGRTLGVEGLLDLLRQCDPADPSALVARLLERIAAAAPGNMTDDDVTVLLFRANGLVQKMSLRDKLATPVRLFRAWARSLVHGDQPMPWPEPSLPNIGGPILNSLNRTWTRRNTPETIDGPARG